MIAAHNAYCDRIDHYSHQIECIFICYNDDWSWLNPFLLISNIRDVTIYSGCYVKISDLDLNVVMVYGGSNFNVFNDWYCTKFLIIWLPESFLD